MGRADPAPRGVGQRRVAIVGAGAGQFELPVEGPGWSVDDVAAVRADPGAVADELEVLTARVAGPHREVLLEREVPGALDPRLLAPGVRAQRIVGPDREVRVLADTEIAYTVVEIKGFGRAQCRQVKGL